MNRHYLILGGARSGKSRYAEDLSRHVSGEKIYVATGEPGDEEMRARIKQHRERRGGNWRTLEEPLRLHDALRQHCATDHFVLVDCLTLWLSNLMLSGLDVRAEVDRVGKLIPEVQGTLVFVSNEVGLGIVPENELARDYRDLAGFANQQFAAACDEVIFMVAGLPLKLKG
jgi:adenosylcobinamide kinase/adenosylcobinamide-phosphate guanylyltransferase